MPSLFVNAAEPELAERDFTAFTTAFKENCGEIFKPSDGDKTFLKIFGNSRFLCQHLIRNPKLYLNYKSDPFQRREKPFATLKDELKQELTPVKSSDELTSALKKFKYREFLRLTLRELALDNQEEIYREFSHLCQVICQLLILHIHDELCERLHLRKTELCDFALIAMGKLGGRELNYSSDIDLIPLYESDTDAEKTTRHEFFAKVFAAFGTKMQTLDADGFLYRVDWDLRPEGKTGTLANSLTALETYYAAFGEDWERQAFIKASVLYQEQTVGNRFLEMMTPFVYRKYFDQKTFERLRDMKSRIITEMNKRKIDGVNIKNGHGGIRDVEFIVQGLQLLNGGKHPEVRTHGTLETLEILVKQGLMEPTMKSLLKDAYLFLRRVESALQMEDERQTHVLKSSPAERLKVARRLGATESDAIAVERLNETVQKTMTLVHNIFREFHDV